ncbi:hypothetical protein HII36_32750 [Nonomuraea sp. NN258]|uniref:hypothetical protein n=1 Tax=Nonomuraea antri TaxID=2730852 RepID=UPI001569C556|nr:hypothetical protein [Nonomuraea antri]NRQ36568.1 hypothetical protein [Nonomuraea antri]
MHRTIKRVVLSTLMLLPLVVAPGTALADHDYDGLVPTDTYDVPCLNAAGPGDGNVCQTDNADLYWYADKNDYAALEANDQDALRTMLAGEFVPTDLALAYDSSPVFSGSGETDVVFQEETDGLSGYLGFTWCDDAVNGEWYTCDQTYIRIETPDGYRRFSGSIACHETGHAVGLVHGPEASPRLGAGDNRLGCMENADEFPRRLGAAGTHLINVTY